MVLATTTRVETLFKIVAKHNWDFQRVLILATSYIPLLPGEASKEKFSLILDISFSMLETFSANAFE